MKTVLSIQEDNFLINGKLTYSEIDNCPKKNYGLLMNSRMIQGVFDDTADVSRFNRFGKKFDPEQNTDDLIKALPQWYAKGLRAITVGFQGGGPCFTTNNNSIENRPYSSDGLKLDEKYASRMKRIIDAADEIGMVVIVSLLYGSQSNFQKDDIAVMNAVKTGSNWLRDNKFTNVIVEVANEFDVKEFKNHPIVFTENGMAGLIEMAKRESGGMSVGCSPQGGNFFKDVVEASDVILIHGNGTSKQGLFNLIKKCKEVRPTRPIVCNEDSQAISQLVVCFNEHISWGYYNNTTKQEPPTYWEITKGEDEFYAKRLAIAFGIEKDDMPLEEHFYIQGLEATTTVDDKRWLRLASLYPEKINYVDFYRNGYKFDSAYVDPFTLNHRCNWLQGPTLGIQKGEEIKAVITLTDGTVIEKVTIAE